MKPKYGEREEASAMVRPSAASGAALRKISVRTGVPEYDLASLRRALDGMLEHRQLGQTARLLDVRREIEEGHSNRAVILLGRIKAWHQNVREARRDLGMKRAAELLVAIDHTVLVLKAVGDATDSIRAELNVGLIKKGYSPEAPKNE